ncbi:hypothetical protein [Cyanobium sp. Morenito 9A2]|uniref:hypothetical protein n=1 Tax=Cyanobium sp. Morenito 9A2 TaxID=2823718 RepID=UPI0020CC3DF6|nr:hypothetical protein [Cyanobium sp. Morenito 9A2]MCP9849869.1 hypothetical protein [Cyanobium sp. Morenito 9A2]
MADSAAAQLYDLIRQDGELTRSLFRQALQDPGGTVQRIRQLGQERGLELTDDTIRQFIASLDDDASKQWLVKARGGL